MRLRTNIASGATTAALGIGDTSLTLDSLTALPSVPIAGPDYYTITLDPLGVSGDPEIVAVISDAVGAGPLVIRRGQEGTTARAHDSGTAWAHAPTALDFQPHPARLPDAAGGQYPLDLSAKLTSNGASASGGHTQVGERARANIVGNGDFNFVGHTHPAPNASHWLTADFDFSGTRRFLSTNWWVGIGELDDNTDTIVGFGMFIAGGDRFSPYRVSGTLSAPTFTSLSLPSLWGSQFTLGFGQSNNQTYIGATADTLGVYSANATYTPLAAATHVGILSYTSNAGEVQFDWSNLNSGSGGLFIK